jgi:hypothetical protein
MALSARRDTIPQLTLSIAQEMIPNTVTEGVVTGFIANGEAHISNNVLIFGEDGLDGAFFCDQLFNRFDRLNTSDEFKVLIRLRGNMLQIMIDPRVHFEGMSWGSIVGSCSLKP